MNKIFLFTTLLFSVTLFGQITPIKPLINFNKTTDNNGNINKYNGVYKWEAYTAQGTLIFGMNKSKAKAKWVISDFTKRNEKNIYKPIGHIIIESEDSSDENVDAFKKKNPKGYKVLLPRDLIALRMIKVKSINSAADFIESVTKKSHKEAFEYVFKLNNNFKSYSIAH